MPYYKQWSLFESTMKMLPSWLFVQSPDDNDEDSNIIWCFADTTMKMCGHVHTGAAHEANFD